MIEPMKAKQSLRAAELQDGDIVCFQKVLDVKEPKSSAVDQESISPAMQRLTLTNTEGSSPKSLDHIDDARDFYDFLHNKRTIRFHPHPRSSLESKVDHPEVGETFNLTLSSKQPYDTFAARVGLKLGINPTYIRFWTASNANGAPKAPVKRNNNQPLQSILNPPYSTFSNNTPRQDALYYEVLEMSLSELDTKKPVKVMWVNEEDRTKDVSHATVDGAIF
jgi:ubiquitin carboxyl-terminal hydrolase 7